MWFIEQESAELLRQHEVDHQAQIDRLQMDHDHQMARIRLDHDEQISAMIRKHQDAKTLLEVEVARAKCSTEVVSGFPTGYAMPSTSQSKNPYFPSTDNLLPFRSESERPLISFKQVLIIHSKKSTILISQNHQYPLDNIPHQAHRHTTAVSPNPNPFILKTNDR